MDFIFGWLDGVLTTFLPPDIFSRLDVYYDGTILCLGAGLLLVLAALALLIAAVRKGKKHAPSA
ncbi:MAG: hypothetical protein ACOX83_04680 [Candidatus Spyradocola sp.]|jgi:hypothetical protein